MWRVVFLFVLLIHLFTHTQASSLASTANGLVEEYVNDFIEVLDVVQKLPDDPKLDVTWQLAYLSSRSLTGLNGMKEVGRLVNRSADTAGRAFKTEHFKQVDQVLSRLRVRTVRLSGDSAENSREYYVDFRKASRGITMLFDLQLVQFFNLYNRFTLRNDIERLCSDYRYRLSDLWLPYMFEKLISVNSSSTWLVQHHKWADCNIRRLSTFYAETLSYVVKGLLVDEFYSGVTRDLWSNERGTGRYRKLFNKIIRKMSEELNRCSKKNMLDEANRRCQKSYKAEIAASYKKKKGSMLKATTLQSVLTVLASLYVYLMVSV